MSMITTKEHDPPDVPHFFAETHSPATPQRMRSKNHFNGSCFKVLKLEERLRDGKEETPSDADSAFSPYLNGSDDGSEVDSDFGRRSVRPPIRFFVGLDDSGEESEESDYLTAEECEPETDEEEEDGFDVAFESDFTARLPINRSRSWAGVETVDDWPEPARFDRRRRSSAEPPGTWKEKHVHFEDRCHNQVHCIVAWKYAYRAARKGPWEIIAAERDRFRKRIRDLEMVLSPVLSCSHRESIKLGITPFDKGTAIL
eukprot:m.311516 g.311516  ORF g.311516 m.311516 type:complete len:257 (+) comp75231_c0_seq1:208-978(+)